MHRGIHIMLLLLLTLAAQVPVAAQDTQVELADGDTVDLLLCHYGESTTVTAWSRYVIPLDAVARVTANGTVNVTVNLQIGFLNDNDTTDYPFDDYAHITCADSVLVDSTIGFRQQTFTGCNGPVEIHVHLDTITDLPPNTVLRRVIVTVTMSADSCSSLFYMLEVGNFDTSSARFSFYSSRIADSVALVSVDGGEATEVPISGYRGLTTLHGLMPGEFYTVSVTTPSDSANHCCYSSLTFRTPGHIHAATGCIDATDLHADYVECSAGRGNRTELYEVIDYGINPRHLVITDTSATDPLIGQLKMVCPGCDATVRLGNNQVGAEWEAVTYALTIDTNINSTMILKYAAVLENPGHNYNAQPRFSFDLLDNNMQSLAEECGHALFVAGDENNWHQSGQVQWRNWTTVGFDLSAYHGQTLLLRFSTADCTEGAHYGYAYYTTQCTGKRIAAEHCGNVAYNTFSAPDGFHYHWTNQYGDYFGSTRSITVSSNSDTYYCTLTSTENSTCQFTISAYAGIRLPVAQAEVASLTTDDCRDYTVSFHNSSHIGSSPNERPDEVMWIFSDGDTSFDYHPTHVFHGSGPASVTLVAGLCGWQCTDTTTLTLELPTFFPLEEDTIVCDSLRWHDYLTLYSDTTGLSSMIIYPDGCDTLALLNLTVNHSFHAPTVYDTACLGDRYSWRGIIAADSLPLQLFHDTLVCANGCDSVLSLELARPPQLQLAISEEHDCTTGGYILTALCNTAATLRWSNGATGTTTTMSPSTPTLVWLTAGHTDSLLCAVSDSLMLRPVIIPHAMLKVVPDRLSYDHPELTAYDISGQDYRRNWFIVYTDGDSIHLNSDAQQVGYTANLSDDSLQVVLAVSNGLCPDTARQTVKMMYVTLFAPNVFTPDREDNNRFFVLGHGINQLELEIYNRNGERIFRTDDAAGGWDGTSGGRPCIQGAYVWHLVYTASDRPDTPRTAIGTVTLLR